MKNSFFTYFFKLMVGLFTGILTSLTSCNAQFVYRQPPDNLVKNKTVDVSLAEFAAVTDYLPDNYSTKGNRDYTKFIQMAIDANEKILMPNFPVLINDTGLHLKSNSEIYFPENSKILLAPSKKTNYGILNIIKIRNLKLYNVNIIGDRKKHIGQAGEWGMGINIIDSEDIHIINPIISDCWGDGIYLGSSGTTVNNNIFISRGIIDNNRRNAISVISGKNISIKETVVSNSNGTLPMAGIDLEPNKNSEYLDGILIKDVTSYNNGDAGFLVYLGALLGENKRNVQAQLINCRDFYSKKSISIPGLRNDYNPNIQKIDGLISIEGFVSNDSPIVFERSSGNYQYTPEIRVGRIKVFNKERRDFEEESSTLKWMNRNRLQTN